MRGWAVASLGFAVVTTVMIVAVRATRTWRGWDEFEPWTALIPTITGGCAVFSILLAAWAFVLEPEKRWTRAVATIGLFGMVPAAYLMQWSTDRRGLGAVAIASALVMAVGVVVVLSLAVTVPARAAVAMWNRWRKRRGRASLDEAATGWFRAMTGPQRVAALLVVGSATWLLIATFLPPPARTEDGAVGAFIDLLARFGVVANDLAIGLAAGAIVMWFQADRFAGPGTPARGRRHRRPDGHARRWASRP